LQLALAAARCAVDNRGQDVVVLDMRDITPIFDYFVVVTGSSRRQLHAISEEIDHTLEDELDDQRMGIEGYNESHWILLDYGTVVIHLFDQETREYYALEDFWNTAIRVPLPDVSLSNTGVSLSNTGVSLPNTGEPLPEGDQETDGE
jgi:ribosome-associated protein